MEQNYNLHFKETGTKKRSGKTRRSALKRYLAIMLSVFLIAGNCLPALALETTDAQNTDTVSVTEDNEQDIEAVSEEQATESISEEQDAGEEVMQDFSEEESEEPEETGSGEEEVNGAPAEERETEASETESPESDQGDEQEDAEARYDENADADPTDDVVALEEAVEPEGVSNEPLAQADAWLSDYDYEFTTISELRAVLLKSYNGIEKDITVPGRVTIDGVEYPVTARDTTWASVGLRSITFSEGFTFPNNLREFFYYNPDTLKSVDMSRADTSLVESMYEMFKGCYALEYVNFGDIDTSNVRDVCYMFDGCSSIEEIDLHCLSNAQITEALYTFRNCSSLQTLNLSGVNLDPNEVSWDVSSFLSGCTSLQEFVTPIIPDNEYGFYIELPGCFADEEGDMYNSLSSSTSGKTLHRLEVPAWLQEYDYYINIDSRIVSLEVYHGEDAELTIPGSTTIETNEFRVSLSNSYNIWGPGVTKLTFGDVMFPRGTSSLLSNATNLQYLDLSEADFSGAVWYYGHSMLDKCGNLQTIMTPVGLSVDIPLPGVFADMNGNLYSQLPKNSSESIELHRVPVSEWLEDYTFELSGDTIILKKYTGDSTEITVPDSAVIGGETYSRIRFNSQVWSDQVVSLTFDGTIDFNGSASSLFAYMNSLEHLDLSGQTGQITSASDMFNNCSSLQEIDLSGYDFSNCNSVYGMFSNCDALQTIKTPVNVKYEIKLPCVYSDTEGNIYSYIPADQKNSITLTKVTNISEWLSDYEYHIEGDRIKLERLINEDAILTIPGNAVFGTTEVHKVEIARNIWNTAMQSRLCLEEGVILPQDSSKLFKDLLLSYIDLSKADVSETTDMSDMFTGCRHLETIITPKNTTCDTNLPGAFVDGSGNIYTSLPKNLSTSITLTRATQSQWLDDYEYVISGDKIILTRYLGYASEVTVPGSAVVNEISFDKIEIGNTIHFGGNVSTLSFSEGVVFPEDCSGLFADCHGLESIDLSNMDTSHVVNMSEMFGWCYNLSSLDVSGFNTSNVTDMSGMFNDCSGLTALDVAGFDTSEVTDISAMFCSCSNLETLDVSGFDTSNVTDMHQMFSGCNNLSALDVSGFDTSDVTDMSRMFQDCISLTSLDVSGFDTSNVTDMLGMFTNCQGLSTLDLSGFNTSKVTNMAYMFERCNNLQTLNLSGFDTSGVTRMDFMFYGCERLTSLDVSGFVTSNAASFEYLFRRCTSLTKLDIGNWDLSSIETAYNMLDEDVNLGMIKAPAGMPKKVGLPAVYAGSDGEIYTSLPMDKEESIILTWISESGDPAYSESADPSQRPIIITQQPADTAVAPGGTAVFTVAAEGADLTYRWQWSRDGMSWSNCASGTYNTNTFSLTMKKSFAGRQYRCKITSGTHLAYTRNAELSLGGAQITTQPADVEAAAGERVSFSVTVSGAAPVYQWQWSSNGTTWKNCTSSGYNKSTFSFTMKATLSGRRYRCIVTDGGESLTSDAALITLKEPALEITSQPQNVSAAAGETVSLHVGANRSDATYQWQWSSNGTTWKNCTSGGYNKSTFSFAMKETLSGRQYRCKVTGGGEMLTSEAASITLFRPVVIISQPSDVEAAAGETVTFTVEAESQVEGEEPAYQWQWRTDGKTWKNCTSGGYNKSTFSFLMKETLSGRDYRCKVTCGNEIVYSVSAKITLGVH